MLQIYCSIDFEDPFNDESVYTCGRILDIFHESNIKPLIFITGDVLKKMSLRKDEFCNAIKKIQSFAIIGYHTNAHTQPVAFQLTDVPDWSVAMRNAKNRELFTLDGNKNAPPIRLFQTLFTAQPTSFRFPGFSWTPAYLEVLKSNGMTRSFDLYPEGLAHLPNVLHHKGITFIKPDYIVWADELVRRHDMEDLKRKIRVYCTQYHCINISLHPNRFCNKEWWMDYLDAPETMPKFSSVEIETQLVKFRELLTWITRRGSYDIQSLSGDGDSPPIKHQTFSENDVDQILRNASVWPQRKFGYEPKYLRDQFVDYFLG